MAMITMTDDILLSSKTHCALRRLKKQMIQGRISEVMESEFFTTVAAKTKDHQGIYVLRLFRDKRFIKLEGLE